MMKRIGCLFGNHWYNPSVIEFFCYGRNRQYGTYNVKCKCLYCGKQYDGLVEMSYPDAALLMKEVSP